MRYHSQHVPNKRRRRFANQGEFYGRRIRSIHERSEHAPAFPAALHPFQVTGARSAANLAVTRNQSEVFMTASSPLLIKNFINGEWTASPDAKRTALYNPSTGEQIGEVPLSTTQESEAATASAHAAYPGWRRLSLDRRVSYLFAIREAMRRHQERLAQAIALDQGKHISEARGEVQRVIQIVETSCSIPTLLQGETLDHVAGNIVARVIREPLGVFGGVAPFNFPALVFGWFIPFAIGVGNTFVFKPSTQSPYFMQLMGEIFQEIELPPGVVNILHGDRSVPGSWYDDPRMSGVCLVGSTPTARKMAEACGRGGKRSMLLGGAKNYLVVLEDAQMEVFTPNFINSCFGSAGQRCLAGSLVAVTDKHYDQVLEVMINAAKGVAVGDARDESVYMGPLISAKAKATVEKHIDIAVSEGAKLEVDGRNPSLPEKNRNGYFVGPTVLSGVTPCMTIAKEEVFGPVVSVVRVNCMEHALELIRAQPFGNGACVFTQNLHHAERFISEADVGMVGVNVGVPAPHPYVPFGGIKDSHLGTNKVQGKDGIGFFTQNKVATIKFAHPDGQAVAADSKHTGVRSCVAR